MRWGGRSRWARAVLAVLLAIPVLGLLAGGLAQLRVETGVDSFTPQNDPSTHALKELSSSFGGDPIVVLLESSGQTNALSGQQLPRLLDLEGKLSRLPDVASVYGPASLLNQIAGQTQNLLAELTGYRDSLRAKADRDARAAGASAEQARRAAERATADFDGRYGGLLAQGLPGGLPTLHNERFVHNVVFGDGGSPRPQWHFVVPSPGSVAVLIRPREGLDQDATERLTGAVRQAVDGAGLDGQRSTVSGGPAIVSALGAEVRHEAPILGGVALLAVGAWFLFVRWTSWRRRMLPLLTTVVGTAATLAAFGWSGHPVSLGAVAFLPILLGVGSDFMTYLQRRVGVRVVVSVALATAASFGALAATPIPAVRELGFTLTIGIVLALAVALVANRRWQAEETVHSGQRWPRSSLRVKAGAGAAVALLAVTGWALLPAIQLTADPDSFAGDLTAMDDARHVERVMGYSGEIDVVLSGPNTVSRESLDWMRRAQEQIVAGHGDRMRPSVSPPMLLSFLGPAPTTDQLESALRLLPDYLTSSVIRNDQRMSVLSFGVRLGDAGQMTALRDDLLRSLPPPPPGMSAQLTGLPLVAVASYDAVSQERYLASGLGILAAGAVLALGLRRRGDALRAMAASAIASGLGLLGMWLAGITLTPLTVAVGSLTAAVGCEFTVILAEARRRGDAGIGRAVVLAVAASATGYSVLAVSGLSLVREFGALLAATVVLAAVSAAFVVWATTRDERGTAAPDAALEADRDLVGVSR